MACVGLGTVMRAGAVGKASFVQEPIGVLSLNPKP